MSRENAQPIHPKDLASRNQREAETGFEVMRLREKTLAETRGAVTKENGRLDFSNEPFVLAEAQAVNEAYDTLTPEQRVELKRTERTAAIVVGNLVEQTTDLKKIIYKIKNQ